MPVRDSSHTPKKQREFETIAVTWLSIVRRILQKYEQKSWLHPCAYYFDLTAGTGRAPGFPGLEGSAAIMTRLGQALGVPLEHYLCEMEAPSAELLRGNVGADDRIHVLEGDHRDTIPMIARQFSFLDGTAFGLLYWDANGETLIPIPTIRLLAEQSSLKLDILLHVSAGAIKRAIGAGLDRPRLREVVASVGKKHVHIQRPDTAWQWTFLLFTDSEILDGKFARLGMHNAESPIGWQWLERLTHTREEWQSLQQHALPFDGGAEEPRRASQPYFQLPGISPSPPFPGDPRPGDDEGRRRV